MQHTTTSWTGHEQGYSDSTWLKYSITHAYIHSQLFFTPAETNNKQHCGALGGKQKRAPKWIAPEHAYKPPPPQNVFCTWKHQEIPYEHDRVNHTCSSWFREGTPTSTFEQCNCSTCVVFVQFGELLFLNLFFLQQHPQGEGTVVPAQV